MTMFEADSFVNHLDDWHFRFRVDAHRMVFGIGDNWAHDAQGRSTDNIREDTATEGAREEAATEGAREGAATEGAREDTATEGAREDIATEGAAIEKGRNVLKYEFKKYFSMTHSNKNYNRKFSM